MHLSTRLNYFLCFFFLSFFPMQKVEGFSNPDALKDIYAIAEKNMSHQKLPIKERITLNMFTAEISFIRVKLKRKKRLLDRDKAILVKAFRWDQKNSNIFSSAADMAFGGMGARSNAEIQRQEKYFDDREGKVIKGTPLTAQELFEADHALVYFMRKAAFPPLGKIVSDENCKPRPGIICAPPPRAVSIQTSTTREGSNWGATLFGS